MNEKLNKRATDGMGGRRLCDNLPQIRPVGARDILQTIVIESTDNTIKEIVAPYDAMCHIYWEAVADIEVQRVYLK